jgi:hypothetical protein
LYLRVRFSGAAACLSDFRRAPGHAANELGRPPCVVDGGHRIAASGSDVVVRARRGKRLFEPLDEDRGELTHPGFHEDGVVRAGDDMERHTGAREAAPAEIRRAAIAQAQGPGPENCNLAAYSAAR